MQSDFLYLVENELADMRERHQDSIAGPQIAYRAITQIALSRTFRYHTSQFFDGSEAKEPEKAELLKELVQIAAMCYRAAEDLQLVEAAEPEPAHEWCKEHKGLRFRADDPNQEKLGMSINYKCLHGVEWTVTGACVDALRLSQFNHCDCSKDDPNLDVCPRCGSMADKGLRVICTCPIG